MKTLRFVFAIILIAVTSLTAHARTVVVLPGTYGQPEGIALDSSGNVFVTDSNNNSVKEITKSSGYTTVLTLGTVPTPVGIAVDADGNVFVADHQNGLVKEMLSSSNYVTVNTLGSGFVNPVDVALDSAGNVIVADSSANEVKRILKQGGYVTVDTLASGSFSHPAGVAVDANDNVFVADQYNSKIKKILASGGYGTVTALHNIGNPNGVAVDAEGNVFVADPSTTIVQEILAAGGYTTVQTIATGFNKPTDVAVDASGNVFVTDYGNNLVKEILAATVTTTSLTSSSHPSVYGEYLTFTATVFGSSPTGTVDFKDGATTLCSGVPLTGSGQAACSLASLAVASHSIKAFYSGDVDNQVSSATLTQVVNKAATSVSVSGAAAITLGQSVTVTATIGVTSPGAGTASGTITVSDGSATCSITLPATSCSLTPTSGGSKTVTASYAGDSHLAASSNTTSLTVNPASSGIALASDANPSVFGQNVTFSATVTGSSPTGTVDFLNGATSLCAASSLSAGQATCAISNLGVGAHSITAVYSGDANNASSTSAAVSQVVNKAATTTSIGALASITLGQTVTVTPTLSVTAPGAGTPTGMITVSDGTTTVSTSLPVTTITLTPTSAGSKTITVSYSGDTDFKPSSATTSLTVNKAATSINVSAPGPITLGQSVSVTATLGVTAPGAGTPSGSITVSDGSASCSITLPATSCSLTPTSVGSKTITASYAGDTNFASSSNTASLTVNPAVSGTTLASNVNPSVFGQSVTFTATVTGSNPTGAVDFLDGVTPLCSAITLSAGQATCATSALGVGAHSITAKYSGDGSNAVSTSMPVSQTVSRSAASLNVSVPPGGVIFGQPVVISASVLATAPGAGTPTGTISISSGGDTCTIVLPATSCGLTPTNVGTSAVTANYSGDTNFQSASANASVAASIPYTPVPTLSRWMLLLLGMLVGGLGLVAARERRLTR